MIAWDIEMNAKAYLTCGCCVQRVPFDEQPELLRAPGHVVAQVVESCEAHDLPGLEATRWVCLKRDCRVTPTRFHAVPA